MPVDGGERVVRLRRAEVALYWVVGAGWIALLDWLAFTLAFDHGLLARTVAVLFSLAVAVAVVWVLVHASRSSLTITDDGVVVQNPFREVVIPRRELRRFDVTPSSQWIVAETTSGQRVVVWAVSSGLRWKAKARAAKWNAEMGLGA